MPHIADDVSEEFGDDSEADEELFLEDDMNLGGEAGPSSSTTLPAWALDKERNPNNFNASLIRQIKAIQQALQSTRNAGTKALLQAHLESLQLHKLHNVRQCLDVDTMRKDITDLKEATYKKIEEKMHEATMRELLAKLRKETELS